MQGLESGIRGLASSVSEADPPAAIDTSLVLPLPPSLKKEPRACLAAVGDGDGLGGLAALAACVRRQGEGVVMKRPGPASCTTPCTATLPPPASPQPLPSAKEMLLKNIKRRAP